MNFERGISILNRWLIDEDVSIRKPLDIAESNKFEKTDQYSSNDQ